MDFIIGYEKGVTLSNMHTGKRYRGEKESDLEKFLVAIGADHDFAKDLLESATVEAATL